MSIVIPGPFNKWRCGKCKHWNKAEKDLCGRCKSNFDTWADAFMLDKKVTLIEENFYMGTAPAILRELRAIKRLLSKETKDD